MEVIIVTQSDKALHYDLVLLLVIHDAGNNRGVSGELERSTVDNRKLLFLCMSTFLSLL